VDEGILQRLQHVAVVPAAGVEIAGEIVDDEQRGRSLLRGDVDGGCRHSPDVCGSGGCWVGGEHAHAVVVGLQGLERGTRRVDDR